MTNYETYVFILCFIVFALLTAMFSYFLYTTAKMELELIRNGHRDREIEKEYEKKNKPGNRVLVWASRLFSILLCLVFATFFAGSIYIRTNEDRPANGIPSIKVVKSSSMAEKHEKNEYLFKNTLNDQFQQFDLIICEHLPAEEDLELYDVVVYKRDDTYIIHRIVAIEEPTQSHPNERHFMLQGDAVEWPDKFPVLYSQIQGIYKGTRIPFVGSFVMFLQSPAGWLCMLLIVFAMIIAPIVELTLSKAKKERLAPIAVMDVSYRRTTRKPYDHQEMRTHFNRPGSPYSNPRQGQDSRYPYGYTHTPPQTFQVSIHQNKKDS